MNVERCLFHNDAVGKGLAMAKLLDSRRTLGTDPTSDPASSPSAQGRTPLPDDRKVLTGIIFYPQEAGLPWEDLSRGDGLWLRYDLLENLLYRASRGVREPIQPTLLAHLRHADHIDFERLHAGHGPCPRRRRW